MRKPNLVIALCLFLLLLGATFAVSGNGAYASASAGTKHISDDATGGDCTTIGSWDTTTKTCALSIDVGETIQIDNNGITLDGNGYTVTGSGTGIGDIGIHLPSGRTGVTIKNLHVQQFTYGIYLSYSSGNTLTGNTPSNNNFGIFLSYSSSNTLTGNTASGNIQGIHLYFSSSNTLTGNSVSASDVGIFLTYSSSNTLTGNTASNNGYGIRVNHSSSNTLTSNTASNNMGGISLESSSSITLTGNTVDSSYENGILLYDSSGNTLTGNIVSNNGWGNARYGIYLSYFSNNNNEVCNNNFINNWAQAYVVGGSGNVFNLAAPVGGNYWSDYDTAAEGCNDVSPADGFCDAPYIFTGGQDDLPWTLQDGWEAPVAYSFSGMLPPINADGSTVRKLGSTIAVKFQLWDANGNFISTATATMDVATITNGVVGPHMPAVSTSAATTGNLFRYDTTDNQYIFSWKTKGLTAGTWQIRITLDDGTTHTVVITLKP